MLTDFTGADRVYIACGYTDLQSEARALTSQQYRWLMEGLCVDQPKAHKPVTGLEIV